MKALLFLPLIALLLSSCSSTVASRIEKNPEIYQKLSPKHKALVDQGRIARGMSKEGVFLSWGKPANIGVGERASGKFERWTYNTLEPVYTHGFHGYYGSRYYRHKGHYHRRHGFYPSYSSNVHYVPRRSAQVDFKGKQVSDWQRGNLGRRSLYH